MHDFINRELRENAEEILNTSESSISKEIINLWKEIITYRNDINHAGWREQPHKSDDFRKKLKEFVKRALEIVVGSYSSFKNELNDV
jgi:hypothetical protein